VWFKSRPRRRCLDAQADTGRVSLARRRSRRGRVGGSVARRSRGGGDVVKKRFSSTHEVAEPQDSPTLPVDAVASCGNGLECRCLETRYGCSTGVESENDGVVNCSYLKVGYTNRPGELGLVAHKAVIRHYIA
jgi:hypothetical protein